LQVPTKNKLKFNVTDTSLLEPSVDSDAAAETVHQWLLITIHR